MTGLQSLWTQIRADLERARETLAQPDSSDQAIREYEHFLENNELELACDMLETYAEVHPVSKEFWIALRDAATRMQLLDRAKRYGHHAETLTR
jgi:hypothetical protein